MGTAPACPNPTQMNGNAKHGSSTNKNAKTFPFRKMVGGVGGVGRGAAGNRG